jgi:hypothetical protein
LNGENQKSRSLDFARDDNSARHLTNEVSVQFSVRSVYVPKKSVVVAPSAAAVPLRRDISTEVDVEVASA